MKVGQIASQYKDIFPPEVARAISKLQRQAPPMPFKEIQSQVEKELGKSLQDLFQQFDEQPFAAASIGQVHKATLPDGQQVVVKVQYPGVEEACESDLKQVRLALRLMGVLKLTANCRISYSRKSSIVWTMNSIMKLKLRIWKWRALFMNRSITKL